METSSFGRWLIGAGLILVVVGLIVVLHPKVPWLGHLPGDIHIQRGNFSLYFPLATCLGVSLILSVVLKLFKK